MLIVVDKLSRVALGGVRDRIEPINALDWQTVHHSLTFGLDLLPTLGIGPEPHMFQSQEQKSWEVLLCSSHIASSHYDTLIELAREGKLTEGVVCHAESGSGFHGFHGRPWVALPGNIHLSCFLAPKQEIANFDVVFKVLPAVAVLRTLLSFPALAQRVGVKWVNDIVLDGAKVAGVLSHTLTQGKNVTGLIMGIGLNVLAVPKVEGDRFVPKVTALLQALPDEHELFSRVFWALLSNLDALYQQVMSGDSDSVIDMYLAHSWVIGREVCVFDDSWSGEAVSPLARGRVSHISKRLELFLEGDSQAITRGRLVLVEDQGA